MSKPKFTPEARTMALDALRRGERIEAAGALAGLSSSAFYAALRVDEELRAAVEQGKVARAAAPPPAPVVVRPAPLPPLRLPADRIGKALERAVRAVRDTLGDDETYRLTRDVHLPAWARELHLDANADARAQAALVLLLEVAARVEDERHLAMAGRTT